MSKHEEHPVPFGGVYSGKIIGAIVRALNLDDGVLKGRTAQRFFAGHPISEHSRTEVFEELGEVLVERGIVPAQFLHSQKGVSTAVVIGDAVELAAVRWDDLMATIQSRSTTIKDRHLAAEGFLRLVVIELALRVFALMRLAGLEPHQPDTPLWAQENGGGKLLRRLVDGAGLTRDQMAARLRISYTSVDNWLDGKNRPTPENIAALADTLAGQTRDMEARQLEREIHRQFTLSQLADLLVPWIGRERIIDLSTALVRFVWLITEDVRGMDRPPIEEAAGAELIALLFGTADPSTHVLLRNLAQSETDEDWKRDILAAAIDWSIPFQQIAGQAGEPRTAAGLAQDVLDALTDGTALSESNGPAISSDPAQESINQLAISAAELGNQYAGREGVIPPSGILETGIARRRAIVHEFPLSPDAHFQLGSFLGRAGMYLRRRDLIDEGVIECKIASGILPNWDAPAVEPGIILANIEEFEEALRELNRAEETLREATPHLLLSRGYVLTMLSRHAEALEDLEKVINDRPDHGLAFLYAAQCSFELGDKVKGIRYAKIARRFGEPGEYIAWRKGVYSSRSRGRSQPTDH